jgi:hypothetical protein
VIFQRALRRDAGVARSTAWRETIERAEAGVRERCADVRDVAF